MVKLVNRAKMTIASGGAGNITLGTAVDGYQTFADAGVSDTDVVRYTIEDGDNWEIGTGVYTASGTTLVRTVTESSNSDAALTCSGDAIIFVTMAAEDFAGNSDPIFTGPPPTSLDLENDGSTAVTLNAKAYDESGIPVSYDWDAWLNGGATLYDSGSLPPQLASAPTINQATGVYSLVGSSNTANEGALNFRVKASDGVMTATHVSVLALTFGFQISDATYTSKSLNNSNMTRLAGMFMSSDGSRCWLVGSASDTIYQHDLSTDFDLSSATYNNVSQPVGSGGTPSSICFNSDGSRLYTTDLGNERVGQYILTNNWDISSYNTSATNHAYRFSFASQFQSCEGVTLSSDDSKLYAVTGDEVYQYGMTTAGDISTASYSNKSYTMSEVTSCMGIDFNLSGEKMFAIDNTSDKVFEYDLSTAWDISSASYSNNSFSIGSTIGSNTNLVDLRFSSDGNHMYICEYTGNTAYQFDVS